LSGFERPRSRRGSPLLATSTIDVGGGALAEHIFAIKIILNITATTSAEILLHFFALLALARPCAAFTRYVRNTISDG